MNKLKILTILATTVLLAGLLATVHTSVFSEPAENTIVTKIDVETGKVEATIAIAGTFIEEVFSPDGKQKFVTTKSGDNTIVTKIDVETGKVEATIVIAGTFIEEVFSPDGKQKFVTTKSGGE